MWYYNPLNRLGSHFTKRLLGLLALAVFVLVCFVCPLVFGLTDLTLRQVGLLPTYTPRPPETPTISPRQRATATRPSEVASLRLRDLFDACQRCGRSVLAELPAPEVVTLGDCLDARIGVLPEDSARLQVTLQVGAASRVTTPVPAAARCEMVRDDGEWQVEALWFQSGGDWRSQQSSAEE